LALKVLWCWPNKSSFVVHSFTLSALLSKPASTVPLVSVYRTRYHHDNFDYSKLKLTYDRGDRARIAPRIYRMTTTGTWETPTQQQQQQLHYHSDRLSTQLRSQSLLLPTEYSKHVDSRIPVPTTDWHPLTGTVPSPMDEIEIVIGRGAMLAAIGLFATEMMTGHSLPYQIMSILT
jgi:hypothetical protein